MGRYCRLFLLRLHNSMDDARLKGVQFSFIFGFSVVVDDIGLELR